MDEFSDFQMAVASGPGSSPHGHKENRGLSTGMGFHWGNPSPKFLGGNLPTVSQRSQFAQSQQQHIQIGPPSPASNQKKVDKNVGSRLANYNLGRDPHTSNNSVGSQHEQGFHNNVPPHSNQSLIGEEDKYAALRALVSLEISEESPKGTLFTSTTTTSSENQKYGLQVNTEVAKDDDFSDFGDFQSFSNTSSIHPISADLSRTDNGFSNAALTGAAVENNNGPLLPAPSASHGFLQSEIPQFDFGNFVAVPEHAHLSEDFSTHLEIRDLNSSVLCEEPSNIFIAEPSLSADWDDISSLNCDLSINYGDNPLDTDQSSNNDELPLKNNFQMLDNCPQAPPVVCYVGNNLQNSVNIEPASAIMSSNIPSPDDLHVLPRSFIKTSLIGCDLGRVSNNIDNLEFSRSASLTETSNDVLEYIPSHEKNRFDISPETRSIASLDLGNYCPTFDTPECKSFTDNVWNGSIPGNSGNNSKLSHENGSGDAYDIAEQESNYQVGSDKYQCFREDFQMETNIYELTWSRCLESVKEIINAAVDLFSAVLNDNDTIREVVLSRIGKNYIICLSEVYQVFVRIKLSHNRVCGLEGEKLKNLFAEIDNIFVTLASVFIGADTDVSDKLLTNTTMAATFDRKPCGICLCSVDDVQFTCVEYDEVLYHSGCANLWINNVETRLPSLPPFAMQLDENVTYQKTCH